MGFSATESSVSQIIEKLDSLPTVARDTAANNGIALYPITSTASERASLSSTVKAIRPPARPLQRCLNWSATNRSTIG